MTIIGIEIYLYEEVYELIKGKELASIDGIKGSGGIPYFSARVKRKDSSLETIGKKIPSISEDRARIEGYFYFNPPIEGIQKDIKKLDG